MKNIVLISQLSICVMVPTFLCLAIGLWLDGKFGTYFTIPLLIIGIAAGARNAYVLAMNSIKQDEQAKKLQRKLKSIMKLISRRILDRIIDINPSIPGMLIINLIYLILGEIIIIALVPNTMRCAIGFLAGVIYSVFATFHMSSGIRKIVYGGAESRATMIIGYLIRLLVMLILFVLLYFLNIGDLLCAVIGMFSMKVAAYLQPFTDKLITKKGR